MQNMSITVDGHSRVPPGFRFHPTEEELLNYYLRKKVACEKIDLDVIRDVDLNKLEPWDIQEKCRIGSTPQNDWYFFSHKDKKYPTGTRTNRATAAGFWKATGRDKVIHSCFRRIGMRKTLVFYRGRAPHGQKSDWIMHEYRLDDHFDANSQANGSSPIEMMAQEDGWVVCRVFKKKNQLKAIESPNNSSSVTKDTKTQMFCATSDGALEQILQYMGRSCKQESDSIGGGSPSANQLRYLLPFESSISAALHERFLKLPALESPSSLPTDYAMLEDHSCEGPTEVIGIASDDPPVYHQPDPVLGSDWAAMDRLVASHLNGQSEASKQLACFDDDQPGFLYCHSTAARLLTASEDFSSHPSGSGGDGDLWSFAHSAATSSEPMCHMSHSPM